MHDTDAFLLFGSSSIVLAAQMTNSNLVLDQPINILTTDFFILFGYNKDCTKYRTESIFDTRSLPITIVMVYSKLFCPGLPLVPQY